MLAWPACGRLAFHQRGVAGLPRRGGQIGGQLHQWRLGIGRSGRRGRRAGIRRVRAAGLGRSGRRGRNGAGHADGRHRRDRDDAGTDAAPGDPVAPAGLPGAMLDGRHVRGEGLFRDQVAERRGQVLFGRGIHRGRLLVLQAASERVQRPGGLALHGALTAPHDGSGFPLAHPLQVAKDDGGPLPGREGQQGAQQIGAVDDLVRDVGDGDLGAVGVGAHGQAAIASPVPLELVDQDALDVGVLVVGPLHPPPVAEGLDERLLDQVAGQMPVAAEQIRGAMQRSRAATDELPVLLFRATHCRQLSVVTLA